jgi:hypothetical protein
LNLAPALRSNKESSVGCPEAKMKTTHCLAALAAMVAVQADVRALTPPSDSDGPIKLLTCVVTPTGVLEAEVDSSSDDAMTCSIQCTYELGDRKFSHDFNVTIPARYHGRVGGFDTVNGKPGNYSGGVGTCKKSTH